MSYRQIFEDTAPRILHEPANFEDSEAAGRAQKYRQFLKTPFETHGFCTNYQQFLKTPFEPHGFCTKPADFEDSEAAGRAQLSFAVRQKYRQILKTPPHGFCTNQQFGGTV